MTSLQDWGFNFFCKYSILNVMVFCLSKNANLVQYFYCAFFSKNIANTHRLHDVLLFSCPSSSMPTLVIYPYWIVTDWLTVMKFRALKPKSNHTNHTKPWCFTILTIFFRILTIFSDFDQVSEFWPNFWISTKFQNFKQISEFQPNFRISTKSQNFY